MEALDARDSGRVGRFVAELADIGQCEEPFPTTLLAALGRLVPCDDVTFSELDRVRQVDLGCICEPDFHGPMPPVSYWEVRHEHPVCHRHEVTGDFRAGRLTDFVSRRELRSSRIYAEWFRPAEVEHELAVGLDAPLWHTKVFIFRRSGGADFTDNDSAVLDVLRPHLADRYALWQARRRLTDVLGNIEREGAAIVLLDGRAGYSFATEPARELLARYFGRSDNVLPAQVTAWLDAPGQPLVVDRGASALVAHAVGETILLEERHASIALTTREREVLSLVRDGMTNAQIAEHLWISPGTVRRHLENVFAKLGVHTRTAAIRALARL
jgi:DNA-binding CsgD family transcriptional regulator